MRASRRARIEGRCYWIFLVIVFILPILKGKFGVPAVLGMMAAVSILALVVTRVFGAEDNE